MRWYNNQDTLIYRAIFLSVSFAGYMVSRLYPSFVPFIHRSLAASCWAWHKVDNIHAEHHKVFRRWSQYRNIWIESIGVCDG